MARASLTDTPLPGRHPYGAVEPYHLAVEHRVLDDVLGERGVLLWSAQAVWERDLLAQRLLRLLGECREHRRLEDAGGYRNHPDAAGGELPRHGQREGDDPALGGGVGGLPDLAVVGRHACRVDDHPALAVFVRLVLRQLRDGEAEDVEGSDEVYLDGLLEQPQVVDAPLPDYLRRRPDPGTVDDPV